MNSRNLKKENGNVRKSRDYGLIEGGVVTARSAKLD